MKFCFFVCLFFFFFKNNRNLQNKKLQKLRKKKSKNKKTLVKYFLKLYPTTLKHPPPPCPMLGVEGSTSEFQMETPIFFCRFGFVNKKKQHFVSETFFDLQQMALQSTKKSSLNFKFLVDCSAIYCKSKKMSQTKLLFFF